MQSAGGAAVVPQTYEWLDGRDTEAVTRLLTDDRWVAEQKLDGMRCLVRLGGAERRPGPLADEDIRFMSHGGRPLVQAAAAQHFPALRDALRGHGYGGESVLDGELLTGTGELVLFDAPFLAMHRDRGTAVVVDRDTPLAARRHILELLAETLGEHGVDRVRVVPQAVGTEAKSDLLEAVIATATEGICFKDTEALYDWDGNRVRTVLKLKVKRTVDCVVTARNVGEAAGVDGVVRPIKNAHLAVLRDDGSPYHLGSCTMNGKPDAPVGAVVEVEYLSWKSDGHLVQPNFVRVRDDKLAAECTLGQLVPSNREVLEVLS